MNVLNFNENFGLNRLCEKDVDGDFDSNMYADSAKALEHEKEQITGSKGRLKQDFGQYCLELPDGSQLQVSDNGEICFQEPNKEPRVIIQKKWVRGLAIE